MGFMSAISAASPNPLNGPALKSLRTTHRCRARSSRGPGIRVFRGVLNKALFLRSPCHVVFSCCHSRIRLELSPSVLNAHEPGSTTGPVCAPALAYAPRPRIMFFPLDLGRCVFSSTDNSDGRCPGDRLEPPSLQEQSLLLQRMKRCKQRVEKAMREHLAPTVHQDGPAPSSTPYSRLFGRFAARRNGCR